MLRAMLTALVVAMALLLCGCGGGGGTSVSGPDTIAQGTDSPATSAPTVATGLERWAIDPSKSLSCDDPLCYESGFPDGVFTLHAGQDNDGEGIEVGTVTIEVDYENEQLHVTFATVGDWYMSDVHMDFLIWDNCTPDDKYKPIPGQMFYVSENDLDTQEHDFYVSFADLAEYLGECPWYKCLCLIMHTSVYRVECFELTYVSGDGGTMIMDSRTPGGANYGTDGPNYPLVNDSGNYVDASYPTGPQTWEQNEYYDGYTDWGFPAVHVYEYQQNASFSPEVSGWDNGLSGFYNYTGNPKSFFATNGADWIWDKEFVHNPRYGDIVDFQRAVDAIEGQVQNISGEVWVTCDNGYEFKVNGTRAVGYKGATPFDAITLGEGYRTSNLTEPWVDGRSGGGGTWPPGDQNGAGWRTPEYYDISSMLDTSDGAVNLLQFTGVNELMGQPDDGTNRWNGVGPAPYTSAQWDEVTAGPYGPLSSGRYYYDNPGGLIYVAKVKYCSRTQFETAYGGENYHSNDKGKWWRWGCWMLHKDFGTCEVSYWAKHYGTYSYWNGYFADDPPLLDYIGDYSDGDGQFGILWCAASHIYMNPSESYVVFVYDSYDPTNPWKNDPEGNPRNWCAVNWLINERHGATADWTGAGLTEPEYWTIDMFQNIVWKFLLEDEPASGPGWDASYQPYYDFAEENCDDYRPCAGDWFAAILFDSSPVDGVPRFQVNLVEVDP